MYFSSFEINATSGIIQTSSQLDRELRQEAFNLMVTATDQDENVANRNQVSVPLTITGRLLQCSDSNATVTRFLIIIFSS